MLRPRIEQNRACLQPPFKQHCASVRGDTRQSVIVLAFLSATGAPPASPCRWSGNGAVVEAPPLPRPARPPSRHGRLPCQCRQTIGAWRGRRSRQGATETRGRACPMARRPPPPAKKITKTKTAGIQRARYRQNSGHLNGSLNGSPVQEALEREVSRPGVCAVTKA